MEKERRVEEKRERSCFTINTRQPASKKRQKTRVQLLSLSKKEFSYSIYVEKKCGWKKRCSKYISTQI